MPDNYDPAKLVSAGYLVTRTATLPDGLASRPLLTSKVISVCDCLYPKFPGNYAIEWCACDDSDRIEELEGMGIPEELHESAMDWATEAFDEEYGAWSMFFTLEAARACRKRFLKNAPKVRIFGLAMAPDDAARYVKANLPPKPEPGYAPEGMMGHVKMLMDRKPVESGGTLLGYELLDTAFRTLGCSWLCYQFEEALNEETGLQPNEYGLLTDYREAEKAADIINERMKDTPSVWHPWALIEYPLK